MTNGKNRKHYMEVHNLSKVEFELLLMRAFAKKHKKQTLLMHCNEALNNLTQDDGTPGLGQYLWDNYVLPNLKKAREEYSYEYRNMQSARAACIIANALSQRRRRK